MPYTATQLRTEIRRLLNETTAAFFLDADIDAWIVDATLDISVKARCVESTTTTTIISGATTITAPTASIGIEAVMRPGNLPLHKARVRMFGSHSDEAGPPSMFSHFAGTIYLSPPSDGTYAMTILYWKRSATYTDLPEEYQLLALIYGVMRGKLKDRKYAEAAQLYGMYIRELQFQRNDLQDRQPDSRQAITIPDLVTSANNA